MSHEKRLTRREFLRYAGVTAAAATLAACAPKVATTVAPAVTQASAATQAPTTSGLSYKGHNLVVWIGGHAVEQEPIWEWIRTGFETKTGAKVDLTLIGFDVYYQKLASAFEAGSPPDVAHADLGGWVPAFASKDYIIPLEDKLATWDGTSQIWPNLWVTVSYQGKRWAVPWDTDCRFLIYNKQMLKDAGLDPEKPPTTWQDLIDYAQKLTQPDKGIYGYGVSGIQNELATLGYMMFLGGNGGHVLNADWTASGFNTPGGLEALKMYTDLYTKYKVSPPGTPSEGEDEYRTAMAQGKIAMAVGGPWSWPLLYAANPAMKGNVGTSIHPYNKTPFSVNGGWGSVIAKVSKEQELAWEFIKFYTSHDVWMYWMDHSDGPLPTRMDVTKDHPAFKDPLWQTTLNTYPKAEARPPIPQWTQISNEIQVMVQNVLTGKATPEDAIAKAGSNVDALLKT
jgi:multiple sugar transport system substrate-binding protein